MFLGNGEKAGSGADIIKKGWKDNKWPQPILSERVQPNESILTLSVGDVVENVGEHIGERNTIQITERQYSIIKQLREFPTISAKALSERLSVTSRTIERDLQKLKAAGIVSRKGDDYGGKWIVTQGIE